MGGAIVCHSHLPCSRLAPEPAAGLVWNICSSSEDSETISLSGQRRGKASLRPALPPVQTAEPSLPNLAFNFVAFANMALGCISHISAGKSSQSPGDMAHSRARDQGKEENDPSHLPEKQQAEGSKDRVGTIRTEKNEE